MSIIQMNCSRLAVLLLVSCVAATLTPHDAWGKKPVLPNEEKIALKYLEDAKKGDAEARFRCGLMTACGRRTSVDFIPSDELGESQRILLYANGMDDNGQPQTQKSYSSAVTWFTLAARQNHAPAMFHLALLHEFGRGTPPNPGEALRWLREAAKLNYAPAQQRLAQLSANAQQATRLAGQEAEGKSPVEQHQLATRFREGDEVLPKNRVEAARWYRKAAEASYAPAQCDYAILLLRGEGVPKDEAGAFALFQKAAAQRHVPGEVGMALCLMNGFGVEKNTGKALQLYQAAAAKGSPLAHYNLAVLHSEGRGVPRDEEQALALARNATRLGFVKAHNIIDTIYRSGRGAREPDRENAVKWNKAGDEYFLGRGVTKNLDEAEKLFRQAAATGFLRAKAGLAVVLGKKTKPTAQNKEEALRLLRDSAGGGDPDAQLLLANAILDQYAGGAADKEAVQWLLKAVEQGHSNAANKLAVLHWNSGRGLDKKDPIEGFRLCAMSAVAGVEDSKKGVENFMHGFISNGADPAPLRKILAEVKAANPDLAPLEEIGK